MSEQEMEVEPFYLHRIGDLVFSEVDTAKMPEGMKLLHGNDTYRKVPGGWTSRVTGDGPSVTRFEPSHAGDTAVSAMPEGYGVLDTVDQFRWKVRDITVAAGRRHSVRGVPEVCNELGLRLDSFPVGRGMRIVNTQFRDDLRVLPSGSLISYGNPAHEDYSVWERQGSSAWVKVVGRPTARQGLVATVEEVGGIARQYDWLEEVGSLDQIKEMNAFRVKVWDKGVQGRNTYGWCGVFQQVMRYLGLTEDGIRTIKAQGLDYVPGQVSGGMTASAAQARDLPVGTMLSTPAGHAEGVTTWFQRVAHGGNARYGTRAWASWLESGNKRANPGNYSRTMVIVGQPGDPVPLPNANLLGRLLALPDGTPFMLNGTSRYHKNGENFGFATDGTEYRLASYFNHDGASGYTASVILPAP